MRVVVLGPLTVTGRDGVLEIGGSRVRALLVRLAWDAGRAVSVDSLADAVWLDERPAHPAAALQSLVSRLRRALDDERVIVSGAGWYRLDLDRDAVDAHRFQRLVASGHRALGDGLVDRARQLLGEALTLWAGEPLVDAGDAPYATTARVRLGELRLAAAEDRIEADLASGVDDLTAEVDELIAAHPLRERLRVLSMKILAAQGRTGEALAVFDDARRHLAGELGADPGPALRAQHLAVLRGEVVGPREIRTNLPAAMTSFVGREREREILETQLAAGRLVTLVGPGGVGKTRLATTFAAGYIDRVRGGVWLVELAAVDDPARITSVVLGALGPHEIGVPDTGPGREDPSTRLIERLAALDSLLVLDNCEHLVAEVAGLVHRLLARCPGLRVVATSREPLGVDGERLCPVAPLPLPEPGDALENSPAVRLFADRAAAVRPGFRLTGGDAEVAVAVCDRLDGLPLAIELAAARLSSMSPAQLAGRLDDRFRLLAVGPRTAAARHRTLAAVLDWSWNLLCDNDRAQAVRLAAFTPSFTVEAAARVGVAREVLDSLVAKSLVQAAGERYRMLDTIRDYAGRRLADSGSLEAVRAAHARYYTELAERGSDDLRGARQLRWLTILAQERDNLSAALSFAADSGDVDTAMRLAAAAAPYWVIRDGHADAADRMRIPLQAGPAAPSAAAAEGAAQYLLNTILSGRTPDLALVTRQPLAAGTSASTAVRALLAMIEDDADTAVETIDGTAPGSRWERARLMLIRAMVRGGTGGDSVGMRRDLASAAAAFEAAGDRWGRALSLTYLGLADDMADDTEAAATELEQAAALVRELGAPDHFQRAWLARMHGRTGHPDRAGTELNAIVAEGVSGFSAVLARLFLADLARYDERFDEAAAHLREAARRPIGGEFPEAMLLSARAFLALARGDTDGAGGALRSAAACASAVPDMPMMASIAVAVADLAQRSADAESAAIVLGAAHALRGADGARDPDVRRLRTSLRATLGTARFDARYHRGLSLDRDAALSAVTERLRGRDDGNGMTAI